MSQNLYSRVKNLAEAVQDIAGEMRGVARSLVDANNALNLPEIDNLVGDMNEALQGIEDTSEIMEESMDGLFEGDTDETEIDSLLSEYGAEVGIAASSGLPAPKGEITALEKEIESLRNEEEG